MKRLLLISLLVLFGSCEKEDNSALIDSYLSQISLLNTQISTYQNQVFELQSNNNSLAFENSTIPGLQNTISLFNEEIDSLNSIVSNLKSQITFLQRFHYSTFYTPLENSDQFDGKYVSFSNEEPPNEFIFTRWSDNYCRGFGQLLDYDNNIYINGLNILENTYEKIIFERIYNSDQTRLYEYSALSDSKISVRSKLIKDNLYNNVDDDWGDSYIIEKVNYTYKENYLMCTFIKPNTFRGKFD
jgi:hypothetical protein